MYLSGAAGNPHIATLHVEVGCSEVEMSNEVEALSLLVDEVDWGAHGATRVDNIHPERIHG